MNSKVFIVGTQRCSTTYLCRILDLHPDVHVAKPFLPEPKFFIRSDGIGDYTEYFTQFKESVWVEKSACYSDDPKYANVLHSHFPDAHVIICIRDPIERAVSQYNLTASNGLEHRDVEDAFFGEPLEWDRRISMSPYKYLERGNYLDPISRYCGLFQNVTILVKEEFVGDSTHIYNTLGLNDFSVSEKVLNEKVHHSVETVEISNALQHKLVDYFKPGVKDVEDFLGRKLWEKYCC